MFSLRPFLWRLVCFLSVMGSEVLEPSFGGRPARLALCALWLWSGCSGARGLAQGRAFVSDGSRASTAQPGKRPRPTARPWRRQPPRGAPGVSGGWSGAWLSGQSPVAFSSPPQAGSCRACPSLACLGVQAVPLQEAWSALLLV